MAEIELYFNRSVGDNASLYYEQAKKARKKVEGARAALASSRLRLEELGREKEAEVKSKEAAKPVKKEWFEKFRWFVSSEGFLCIGGRDATTNEIVVKKHVEKDDLIFHTEMAGSPFFVVKAEGKNPGKATLDEAAQAVASYSKAWKLGLASAETFYVSPGQVTKEAKAGEFVARGAFMVYGKKNFVNAELKIAVGIIDGKIIGGPVAAVKKHSKKAMVLIPGKEKSSDIAKKVKKELGGDIDDIMRFFPSGGLQIE